MKLLAVETRQRKMQVPTSNTKHNDSFNTRNLSFFQFYFIHTHVTHSSFRKPYSIRADPGLVGREGPAIRKRILPLRDGEGGGGRRGTRGAPPLDLPLVMWQGCRCTMYKTPNKQCMYVCRHACM